MCNCPRAMTKDSALRTYLKKPEVRPAKVASDLEIDRVTLWRWASAGVPEKRLADVAKVTGLQAAALRPDLAAHFSEARVSA
jgi:hypothetical protein